MSIPVLLVHGFMSTRAFMLPLQIALQRRGLDVHRANLSPLCIQDVRVLARQVGDDVQRVRGITGAREVDLVAISQGGIAAVTYVRTLGGHRNVRRVVTLGAPFRGTWIAAAGLPVLGLVSAGVWQSLPNSELVEALARSEPSPGEHIVSVSRRGDPVAPPEACHLPGAEHRVLPSTRWPLTHQRMGYSPTVVDIVVELLGAEVHEA